MRQIGNIPREADAHRFAAYLVTQGITSHAEQDGDDWVVWVRDENQLDKAKAELEKFKTDPQASRYQRAMREAENVRREEHARRERVRKNVVEMRGRWGTGPGGRARRAPLVFLLIAISIFVTLATQWGDERSELTRYLLFAQPKLTQLGPQYPQNGFEQIAQGQVWRLVTPMFVHFDVMHVVFDMWVLFIFGSQIESRVGSRRFALLVLFFSVMANVGQYIFGHYVQHEAGAAAFGGMSGVDYGLFGYIWIKAQFQPSMGLRLSPFNTFIMFAWFFLCILGDFQATAGWSFVPRNVANAAHAMGLLAGVAVAYVPVMFKSPGGE